MLFAVNTIILVPGATGHEYMVGAYRWCSTVILSGINNSIYSIGGMLVGERTMKVWVHCTAEFFWLSLSVSWFCLFRGRIPQFPGPSFWRGQIHDGLRCGKCSARVYSDVASLCCRVCTTKFLCHHGIIVLQSMVLSVMLLVVFIFGVTVTTFFPKDYFGGVCPVSFNILGIAAVCRSVFHVAQGIRRIPFSLIPVHENA